MKRLIKIIYLNLIYLFTYIYYWNYFNKLYKIVNKHTIKIIL